jgi:ubiquinone/menaquinone biosynthesis C-methylase UbiE
VRAETYDRLNDRFDRAGFGARRDELVAGLTGSVLEIGAGTGRNLPRYATADRVVAVEPSAEYGRRLRERAAGLTVPVELVAGVAESLPCPDASVDHVVSCLTLCSVADVDAVLAQVRRVLRPGGTFEFLEHVRSDGLRGWFQDRLTPLQRRFADGCHLNRDPAAAVTMAGLSIVDLDRFELPPGNPLIRAGLRGRATRPAR